MLVPQAAGARPELRTGLEAKGWPVDAVEAYRTVPHEVSEELLRASEQADAICFASSSAVESYVDQARRAGTGTPPVVACIGPVTAAAARRPRAERGPPRPTSTPSTGSSVLLSVLFGRADNWAAKWAGNWPANWADERGSQRTTGGRGGSGCPG